MAYPTVTLTGKYVHVDGTAAKGSVDIRPTSSPIKDAAGNVVLAGGKKVTLDVAGAFSIALPATDSTALDPTGFGYTVTPRLHHENLDSVTFGLPQSLATLDMADVTPADPDADYAPVLEGPSAYDVAVRNGFVGTEAAWLASLEGPTGPAGPTGPPGPTTWAGITDKPTSFPPEVHGHSSDELAGVETPAGAQAKADAAEADAITAAAADATTKANTAETNAKAASIPLTQKGAASGVAPLGVDSRVGEANLPAHLAQATQLATYGAAARPMRDAFASAKRGAMPHIVSLCIGTEDEVPSIQNGTAALDATRTEVGGKSWRLTSTAGAASTAMVLDPIPPQTTSSAPLTVPPAQAVCAWVYLDDASAVSELRLYLYQDDALNTTHRWNWFSAGEQTLVTGWNFVRVPADRGLTPSWNTLYRLTVHVQWTTAAAPNVNNYNVGHVWLECPEKAKLLFIADRGYKTFYDSLYPQLKAMGVPVTFAVDCTLFGSQAGTIHEAMSLAQMKAVALENGNSISFHGYTGAPTSGMSEAELRTDTALSLKYLQANFPHNVGRMWRAAYVQGSAPQWATCNDLLVGSADGSGIASKATPWPPIDMYRVPRWALDNNTADATIDSWFTWAQKTNMLQVVFVHAYDETYQYSVSNAKWTRFKDQLQTAMDAGWMEAVTFEQLFSESGGSFSQMGGAHVATYTAPDGTFVSRPVL